MNEVKQGDMPLRPHQQELLSRFFSLPAPSTLVVKWPVGAGASYAMAKLLKEVFANSGAARVLVLAQVKVLVEHTVHLLSRMGVPALEVDRYAYRAIQDAQGKAALWGEGRAFVLTAQFASQADIFGSLSAVGWDVLVVLEGHNLTASTARLADALLERSPRLKVLALSSTEGQCAFGPRPRFDFELTRADLMLLIGSAATGSKRPMLEVVDIPSSQEETKLIDAAKRLVGFLRAHDLLIPFPVNSLHARFASSPAAWEEGLRRLHTRLSAADRAADEVFSSGGEDAAEVWDVAVGGSKVITLVDDCLRAVDGVTRDSKLEAFLDLFKRLHNGVQAAQKTCVFVNYRATAFYLSEALAETGARVSCAHGGMSVEERDHVIRNFNEVGGVLVITPVITEGYEFAAVSSLVLYDLPPRQRALEQLFGRFQRIGREEPLRMLAFSTDAAEATWSGSQVSRSLADLKAIATDA